jgi:hypothetical protein
MVKAPGAKLRELDLSHGFGAGVESSCPQLRTIYERYSYGIGRRFPFAFGGAHA